MNEDASLRVYCHVCAFYIHSNKVLTFSHEELAKKLAEVKAEQAEKSKQSATLLRAKLEKERQEILDGKVITGLAFFVGYANGISAREYRQIPVYYNGTKFVPLYPCHRGWIVVDPKN